MIDLRDYLEIECLEYTSSKNRPTIHLFARDYEGKRVHLTFNYRPYCFIRTRDVTPELLEELKGVIGREDGYRDESNRELTKLVFNLPFNLRRAREKLEKKGIIHYEMDICAFTLRWLIDNNLFYLYPEAPILEYPADILVEDRSKTLYLDIEIDPQKETVLAISIAENSSTPLTLVSKRVNTRIENVLEYSSEEELLKEFKALFKRIDPDIIVGWNIYWDIKHLFKRYREHRIPYRDFSPLNQISYTRFLTNRYHSLSPQRRREIGEQEIIIKGREVFDLARAYKQYFKRELKVPIIEALDKVARRHLGKGQVPLNHTEIPKLWSTDPDRIIERNRRDVTLLQELERELHIIEYFNNLRKEAGVRLRDVWYKHRLIDSGLLRIANWRLLSARQFPEERESYTGALRIAKPGIYENLILIDFDSFYPREVLKFNICYDEATRVLTDNGWKFFKELTPQDRIATLENGRLTYVKPKAIQTFEYEGKMYSLKSREVNLLVTPEHRLYVKEEGVKRDYELRPAKEVYGKVFRCKKDAKWIGREKKWFYLPQVFHQRKTKDGKAWSLKNSKRRVKMDDWLEFLGYYLTEGCCHPSNYAVILVQKDSERREKMKKCIQRMGFSYKIYGNRLVIGSKQLWSYLKKLGKAHEKYIPREFMSLSKRQLLILYKALLLGDGYSSPKYGECLTTCSERLALDYQELMLKIGFAGTISLRRKTKRPVFKVQKVKKMLRPLINKWSRSDSWQDYKGKVYCCTVPNGIIYVQREGKSVWSGNSPETKSPNGELEAAGGYRFKKRPIGLMPRIVSRLLKKKSEVKRLYKKNPTPEMEAYYKSVKYLTNASYGLLGFRGSRVFDIDCAEAVTLSARRDIRELKEYVEKKLGREVLYLDTDSLGFSCSPDKKEREKIVAELNRHLKGLEVEEAEFFKRVIIVAKTRYVGKTLDGKIVARGLPLLRSDTPNYFARVQKELTEKVLNGSSRDEIVAYCRRALEELEKVPLVDLGTPKSIRKPIEQYRVKSHHIKAIERAERELGESFRVGEKPTILPTKGREKYIAVKPSTRLSSSIRIDYDKLRETLLKMMSSIYKLLNIRDEEVLSRARQTRLEEIV